MLPLGDTFSRALRSYAVRWQDGRSRGVSHDQIRLEFSRFVEEAFPQLERWEIELERNIHALGVRGLIDLLYEHLIFEFKRDLERERAAGVAELQKYIAAQGNPSRFVGLLTDGMRFEAYAYQSGALTKTDEFQLDPANEDLARLALDSYLFAEKAVTPTAEDMVRRFGESGPVFASAMGQLERLYETVASDREVETKFREWDNLLAHVYGSSVGTGRLFLRHTYLVLFTRLLAYAALQGSMPGDTDLPGTVDGRAFEPMGISNLVEPDFFTWVLHDDVRHESIGLLRGLAQHAGVYRLEEITEDVLKELYQHLISRDARHEIGEYYTPDWLAEMTLREAGFGAGLSLLDPACGSGTFLFIAVRLLRDAGVGGEELVRFVFENLAGIDVHPVAVMIAKVNLLLALLPELRALGASDLPPLPVFMADTLNIPFRPKDPGVSVPVHVTGKPARPRSLSKAFIIPRRLAASPKVLDEMIDHLRGLALAPPEAEDDALVDALSKFVDGSGFREDLPYLLADFRLLRWLSSPEVRRNSVWIAILRNAYRPAYFAERKFDVVAGNPPWLAYRYITREDYQEQVKDLSLRVYELLDTSDRRLFTHMDLSTLFFAHCVARFITDGVVALVMPRSVLTGAKHHAKFQTRYRFTKILDLEGVEPLFNVPACVLIHRGALS